MARQLSDDTIRLNIIINGNQAQKELLDLDKQTRTLTTANKDLRKEKAALKEQLIKETTATRAVSTSIKEQADILAANKKKTTELRAERTALAKDGLRDSDRYKELTADIKTNSDAVKANVARLQELHKEKKALQQQALTESTRYKEITEEIKLNNTTIDANKARMAALQKEIGVNGLTMNQLKEKAMHLSLALRNMVPGSEDYQRYSKDLAEVRDRMNELNGKGKEASWSLGSMADKFNRYGGIVVSFIAGLTGIVLSIQKILDYNSKLSDSYTKVMKTTGMTKGEVDELAKSFGMLKTRTGKVELLGIAEIGGRLGIAKNEIADFVKVMDKSAVALGDSFEGGPNVVAEKLGRIKGLYKELKEESVETAFESVGSALNDLGADGTASEQNLAEFAQRVGTLPEVLRPSIQTVLGMGAAFEESGLKAELAGNNYGKVIAIAARDYPAFAKVMRRSAAEVKNLINTNPNEFFLQFSQSLKGLDATDLAKVLDYLKLNDNEVKMVLGAASQNVDLFRQKIDLATESMADATSLTDEYNLVNGNLAAVMDRLKKKVIGWFTSDSVVAFITAAVDGLAKLIGAVEDNEGAMTGFRNTIVLTAKILAVLVAGFFSYTTAARLAAFWSNSVNVATAYSNIIFRIQYAQLVLQQTATRSLALAKALLSMNIDRVRGAYKALSVTMGMNPFGALFAVIGALIAAFVVFRNKTEEVEKAIKKVNAATAVDIEYKKLLAKSATELKSKIDPLISILKDEDTSLQTRKKAYENLIKISPEFVGTVDKEFRATEKLNGVYIKLLENLEAVSKAKARQALRDRLTDAEIEADNAEYDAYQKAQEEKKRNAIIEAQNRQRQRLNTGGGGSGGLGGGGGMYSQELETEAQDDYKKAQAAAAAARQRVLNYSKYLADTVKELEIKLKKVAKDSEEAKKIQAEINSILGLADTAKVEESGGGSWVPGDETAEGKARKLAAKLRAERLKQVDKDREDNKKYQQETLDLQRRAIDDRLALLQDGFDKEEAIEAENHKRKLEDLKKQLVDEAQLATLDEKINDPKATPIERGVASETKRIWLERNKHLNELIEIEHGRHRFAMETIDLKAETKSIADLQHNFDRETTLRQAKHNEELAALGTNEIAKQKLQDAFDKEELDRQTAHLEKLLALTQDILADKNNQIDLDLLTPEQKQQIEDDVANLKLKLSELMKAKGDLQNKNGSDDFRTAAKNVFGDADVLGFTADQWGKTFTNIQTLEQKMAAVKLVIGALQNAWSMYSDYQTASENASVANFQKNSDAKKRRLKQQLDNGYINQIQYKRGIETLDADLEKRQAEVAYKQAKRQKLMNAANVIMNTSQAIMGIWAQFPKFDFGATAAVMSGVVGALGALQLATIMKTPLPAKGYEKGLYPEYVKREQDGKTFRAGYGGNTRSGMVNKPTYFLAGENGPEMVIDAAAYRQMSPDTKAMLIRELRGIKGFEKGMYNNDVTGGRYEVPAASGSAAPSASGSLTIDQALAIINRNTEILEKIHSEGITAYVSRDARELKKLREDMDRITQSKLKAQS